MKLLLVTQDFPPKTGGIETYCYQLAQYFYRSTDFLGVLAPSHTDSQELDRELPYLVERPLVKDSLLPLVAPFVLIQMMNTHSFDTVLHAQWQTVGASLIARKLIGFPKHIFVAAHARELLIPPFAGNGGLGSKMLHKARCKLLQKVDGFFPVSHYTADLLKKEGIAESKIHVVGNGTDPDEFEPKSTDLLREELGLTGKKVLFSVCRLVPRKGMDLVLKALAELIKDRDDLVYLIGGSGEDKGRLQALSIKLGVQDYVRFTGRIPDQKLPCYYSLADIFVMPAKNSLPDVEGFGIVFLEANACGTPVIGTKTGGIPDAVIDGETGFLIEEDRDDQLVEVLSKLIDNPDVAQRMGTKGRERVLDNATWSHTADALLKKMQLINQY